MRQYNKAIKYYRRVLKIRPNSIPVLNGLGICFLHKGKPKKALDYYMRTSRNGAYPVFILNGMAGCYLEMKDYENADACIEDILDENEKDYHAWRNKGQIQAAQGYWYDAIKYCNIALDINPIYYEAWWIKSTCEYELYMREDAIKSLKKFLMYVPIEFDKIIDQAKVLLRELEDDVKWEERANKMAHFSFTLRDPSDRLFGKK